MNKKDLWLVKNDKGEFLCSNSIKKIVRFLNIELDSQLKTQIQIHLYEISMLSKIFDSNIDCYYGGYSILCDEPSKNILQVLFL